MSKGEILTPRGMTTEAGNLRVGKAVKAHLDAQATLCDRLLLLICGNSQPERRDRLLSFLKAKATPLARDETLAMYYKHSETQEEVLRSVCGAPPASEEVASDRAEAKKPKTRDEINAARRFKRAHSGHPHD